MNKQNKPLITYKYSLYLQSFESLMHWVRSVSQFAEGVAQSPTENPLHWNSARNGLIVFFKYPYLNCPFHDVASGTTIFKIQIIFPLVGNTITLQVEMWGSIWRPSAQGTRLNDCATTAVTNRFMGETAPIFGQPILDHPPHMKCRSSHIKGLLYIAFSKNY